MGLFKRICTLLLHKALLDFAVVYSYLCLIEVSSKKKKKKLIKEWMCFSLVASRGVLAPDSVTLWGQSEDKAAEGTARQHPS